MYQATGKSSSCAKTAMPRPHRLPVHNAQPAASTPAPMIANHPAVVTDDQRQRDHQERGALKCDDDGGLAHGGWRGNDHDRLPRARCRTATAFGFAPLSSRRCRSMVTAVRYRGARSAERPAAPPYCRCELIGLARCDRSTIPPDGDRMASGWWEQDMAEIDKSEKITINVGLIDLGQIDLLVDEGFYVNSTDFIRTAIRRTPENRA